MNRAITLYLSDPLSPPLPEPLLSSLRKSRYTLLGPLLILPSSLLSSHANLPGPLLQTLARAFKVTHIAVAGRIGAPRPQTHDSEGDGEAMERAEELAETLRTPNLIPLHGDFGPSTLEPLHSSTSGRFTNGERDDGGGGGGGRGGDMDHPSPLDLRAACWIPVPQNGLVQVFSPRWTMFSRGNTKEKARVLGLGSVRLSVSEGREGGGRGCAAVDLYVGIGYFAFSYLKAGVDVVYGWDLNGWSLEGLRRGGERNGFGVRVVGSQERYEGEEEGGQGKGKRLVAFHEDNKFATERMRILKEKGDIPSVRHVNCGLLPSSRECWGTAVGVLDKELGGWVHVHENFKVAEIEAEAEGVRAAFEGLTKTEGWDVEVNIEEVSRVKSYAPGVMHCVVDLHLVPLPSSVIG